MNVRNDWQRQELYGKGVTLKQFHNVTDGNCAKTALRHATLAPSSATLLTK